MPLIKLEQVSKIYSMGDEEVRALDGVDLSIEPGEFLAIRGPSGSGKSTLMHIAGFLDSPTSGGICFEGQELLKLSSNARAAIRSSSIGFVFQSFNLLPRLNVLHNTMLPLFYLRDRRRKSARRRAFEALEQVGLTDRIKHKPNQLSGGQKQRVAIARALVNDPKLLLADEPTGNLDSGTAESILALFTDLNSQGRTVVLITHDANVASHAHRQIHMIDGRIAEEICS